MPEMITLAVAPEQGKLLLPEPPFPMTSVLLLDDHPVITNGLATYFTALSDIKVVGQVRSPSEALAFLHRQQPDVVVSDMSFDNQDQVAGIRFLVSIQEQFPAIRVVFYSMVDKLTNVRDAIAAGANAYVLKKHGEEEVYRAICAVRTNNMYYSPELVHILGQINVPKQDDEVPAPLSALTAREIDVMILIAKEYSTARIAEKLFLSESTVHTHRAKILTKLNVTSNVGIAFFAFKYGLI